MIWARLIRFRRRLATPAATPRYARRYSAIRRGDFVLDGKATRAYATGRGDQHWFTAFAAS